MLDTDLGRGGFEFHGPWGTSVAAKSSRATRTGYAGYTDEEIAAMIIQGLMPRRRRVDAADALWLPEPDDGR